MPSIAALWGYRLDEDVPESWQADAMVAQPRDLLAPAAWPAQPGFADAT
jgi:phosphoglycolate phosphatase